MKRNLIRFAAAGALALMLGVGAATVQAAPLFAGQGYGQGPGPGGWDQPPGSYRNDIMRQGYHDGIEGARKDVENHRRPNVAPTVLGRPVEPPDALKRIGPQRFLLRAHSVYGRARV